MMIEYLRNRHRRRILNRLAAKPHKKTLPGIAKVHAIGIVTETTLDEHDTTVLQYFVEHMNRRNIVVTQYHLPPIGDKENLNRLGMPTPESLSAFTSHTYDLLIATTPMDDCRTLFTVLNTPAMLRVAYDNTDSIPDPVATKTYDLFIRDAGPCNLTEYLREILTLLFNMQGERREPLQSHS